MSGAKTATENKKPPQGGSGTSNWGPSLRDYFAVHASQDAVNSITGDTIASVCRFLGIETNQWDRNGLTLLRAEAKARYAIADAMLAEREAR